MQTNPKLFGFRRLAPRGEISRGFLDCYFVFLGGDELLELMRLVRLMELLELVRLPGHKTYMNSST